MYRLLFLLLVLVFCLKSDAQVAEKPKCDFSSIPKDSQGCLPIHAFFATQDCLIVEKACFSTSMSVSEPTKIEKAQSVKEEVSIDVADAGLVEPEAVDAGVIAVANPPSLNVAPQTKGYSDLLSILMGALAGAIAPALTKILKNALKGKNKKDDGVTDCKTHQVRSNTQMTSLSSRVSALESQSSVSFSSDDIEELSKKIEQLEKAVKALKKAKK